MLDGLAHYAEKVGDTQQKLLIAVRAFARCMLTSISVTEKLLQRCMKWQQNSKSLPFKVEMALSDYCK